MDETRHINFLMRLMDSTDVGQSTIDEHQSTDRVRVEHRRVNNQLSCLGTAYKVYQLIDGRG